MFNKEWLDWLGRLVRRNRHGKTNRNRQRYRPILESLEDRTLFSVNVISTAAVSSGPPLATATGQSEADPVHSISANGRYVVFSSNATDLVFGQQNPYPNAVNVFLHDNQSGTTTLISHQAGSPTTAPNRINLKRSEEHTPERKSRWLNS